MSDRTAHKPLSPLTVDHWRRYAGNMKLDSGEYWCPEDFQCFFAEDLFAGARQLWVVIPEGNTKTTTMSGLALYHGDHRAEASVPMAAATREQCGLLFGQAQGFIRRSPGMARRFRVYEGYRRIDCLRTNGRIQVFAADEAHADGIIPTLGLVDELHRAKRGLRLWRTWAGKLWKRDGQLAGISTAGEPGSEFEETREKILREATERTVSGRYGSHIRAVAEGIVLHDYAVRNRRDLDNMQVVAEANPFSPLTPEVLGAKHASPTMTPEHWARFVGNIATRIEGRGVTPEEWDALFEAGASLQGLPVLAGLDLGWKIDHAGIAPLGWESEQRRVLARPVCFAPPVEEGHVVAALLRLQIETDLRGVVFDPNAGGQQMVQQLEKGEHILQRDDDARELHGLPPLAECRSEPLRFIEHSQDNAPMALAASRMQEAIRSAWLIHDGSRRCASEGCKCGGLRAHVLNAVEKPLGAEKVRYDRPADARGEKRSRYPIDLFTAALFANSVAVAEFGPDGESVYESKDLLVLSV